MGVNSQDILEFNFGEWRNLLPPPQFLCCGWNGYHPYDNSLSFFFYKQNMKVKTSFKKFQKEISFKFKKKKLKIHLFDHFQKIFN
jgi:hypothetical protein